ncbi:MAG TPA: glycosyltransferase [Candidatus Acidoferrales bacterium]|nr:glycosyltransferase [Candidatus Acidoferrales bacterium]
MKKIKVVHILPMLGPGGAERMVVHIVGGLNRQRFEVAVVSIWKRVGSDLEHLLDDYDAKVKYLGKRQGFDCRMFHRLHRILKHHSPDVVHTHLHVLPYALPSLLLLKRISWLHTVHNLAEREITPRVRCFQRCALKCGIVPVAVSVEVANSLKHLYGIERCRVIPNGIPTDYYAHPHLSRSEWRRKEGFHEDEILFVCVARFAPQKNHAMLLKAFALGLAANSNAHLVLVGEGILRKALEEQARELGIFGRVRFLGLRTDIPDVLGAMDVFVLSSEWEGNPLSVMEAMSSRLPVVSTAVGGVPDLFVNGREGFLVPPGDVGGISHRMTLLMRDPEMRRSMGIAAARRARENFDVSRMVRDYEQLYENLVGHPHLSVSAFAPHSPDVARQGA